MQRTTVALVGDQLRETTFLWLEITGRCQLECTHCYASSGPDGTPGVMTARDWRDVLDQAANLGVSMVQFIGGEPTLHPDLIDLINHACRAGLAIEVFSNLVHVTDPMWDALAQPGVCLATSYYSDDARQHARITGRRSHARTRANIAKACQLGIPLRAGVIDLGEDQRAAQAMTELHELGVSTVGYDRLRQVGRGQREQQQSIEQLCGHCGDGVAAVGPDGSVWPCVFSRWLPVGNVLDAPLAEILAGPAAGRTRAELSAQFAERSAAPITGCNPDCNPSCGPTCTPCNPRCSPGCQPNCNPAPCQPTCSPRCSPTCDPIACKPRGCWPPFQDEALAAATPSAAGGRTVQG